MSREEFVEKIEKLEKERFNLKREYISEHTPFPINSIVEVRDNRTGKLLIKGVVATYFVSTITGIINVVIHKITKKGKTCNDNWKYYNIEDSSFKIIKLD